MADPNSSNKAAGDEEKRQDIFSRFESFLKLIAGGAAFAAAVGVPAVYLHYSSLGIPSSLITYEQILRAGIVPGLLSLFVGSYIVLAYREYQEGARGWGAFMVPGIMFAPIPVAVFAAIYMGLFAAASWMWWWMLWPLFWVLRVAGGWELATAHFVLASVTAGVNVFVVPLFEDLQPRIEAWLRPRIEAQSGWVYQLYRIFVSCKEIMERVRRGARESTPVPDEDADNAPEPTPAPLAPREFPPSAPSPLPPGPRPKNPLRNELKTGAIFSVVVFLFLVLAAYSIPWYCRMLGVDLRYLTLANIFLLGIIGTAGLLLAVGLFVSWRWIQSEQKGKRLFVTSINLGIALAVFSALVWIYSVKLYATIPAAFGGGALDPVTVWIGKSDLPPDARRIFRTRRCLEEGDVVRCEGFFVIHRTSEEILIADDNKPPVSAVLLVRSAIKAVSWSKAGR
jgi:hypothetical protein